MSFLYFFEEFWFFYKMVCPHFPFEQHLETAVNAYFFYAYYRVSKFKFVGNFKVSTSLTMSCKYVHLSTSKYYLEEYVTFEMQSLKISENKFEVGHHVSWVPLCFQCTLDTYLIGLCELPLSVQQCKLTILTINYATFIIGRIFCRTFDESWLKAVQNTCWKKLLHWIELLCNDVICIKLGNETEKLGSHWTPSLCACFSTVRHFCTLWPKSVVNKTILFTISPMHEGGPTIQSVQAA